MEKPMTVSEAAELSGRHEMTVANALRSGELHGSQRVKHGTWRMRRECVEAWAYGEKCSHQMKEAA